MTFSAHRGSRALTDLPTETHVLDIPTTSASSMGGRRVKNGILQNEALRFGVSRSKKDMIMCKGLSI